MSAHDGSCCSTSEKATMELLNSSDAPTETQSSCCQKKSIFFCFYIGGMSCNSCALYITEELGKLEGVVETHVDFSSQRADLLVDSQKSSAVGDATNKVVELGYTVLSEAPKRDAPSNNNNNNTKKQKSATSGESETLIAAQGLLDSPREEPPSAPVEAETSVLIEGMSCGSCAARVEAALAKVAGVTSANVNFATLTGKFVHNPMAVSVDRIISSIQSLGYEPTLQHSTAPGYARGTAPTTTRKKTMFADPGDAAQDTVVKSREGPPSDQVEAETSILIEGMSCGSCAARVEAALAKVAGVKSANVNFATLTGKFVHNPMAVSVDRIITTIRNLGYEPTLQHSTETEFARLTMMKGGDGVVERHILIEGMACTSCSAKVESTLQVMEEVQEATVNFATSTAVVHLTHEKALIAVLKVIEGMGYTVTVTDALSAHDSTEKTRQALQRTQEIEHQRRLFIGSAILSIPLLIAMILMSFTHIMTHHHLAGDIVDGVQLVFATPIVFYFGRQFFVGAWKSLRHGIFTMDTLVAIGIGCSYLYSAVVFIISLTSSLHMMTYFDTSGMLTTFMLLGRYLEANAKRSTSSALVELMSLVPPVAIKVTPDGDLPLPSSAVVVGDHLRILAGERVPVDGTILEGLSEIDEQMITGESVPKSVKPGDRVVGGTLNVTANFIMVADKIGEETMLSQILRIVQEAQNTKPAVQRMADRVAMYFVPCVVGLSILTLLVWLILGATEAYPAHWRDGHPWVAFAFNFFIATVVAACPCALGLATPTAIMVGTGVGARNGVLVKSGVTLECVRRLTCVVFDKTGTITDGRLQLVNHRCFDEEEAVRRRRLQMVGLVEGQSSHPIAKAVAKGLGEVVGDAADMVVASAITHSGKGVQAEVRVADASSGTTRTHHVLIGNMAMMETFAVEVRREVVEMVKEQHAHGRTTVIGALDGVASVVVSLSDEPKLEAAGVIRHLHKRNIRTMMVTGDHRLVAGRVAEEVGIPPRDVRAETLPAAKASIVKELQTKGYRVMFVGDGINDSPALAQADVGVALGAGTEVAIEAADAVLVRNSLVDLLNLMKLSRSTVHHIYGNFVWACGYNFVMLPLASGALFPLLHFQLPPVIAGLAMVLSSLSVLASSLSIRLFRPILEADLIEHRP